MGWNSWNLFGGGINETQVRAIADAFVSSGLKAAGYQYIVVDDGWDLAARNTAGDLVPGAGFPSGMKALGDYIHARGLKFGMYECPTLITCQRLPGSYLHETHDAQQYAGFGIDFLKYDWCGFQSGEDGTVTVAQVIARYVTMREALKATGRSILYSLSEKAQTTFVVPGTWSDTVGHMWRIGGDINATWASILAHSDQDAGLSQYAGPGGWNDPDMLEVGNGTLTTAENRSHFSLWCMLAAPLMLGNNPSTMTTAIRDIVINPEAIAIDQDSLGVQGQRIRSVGGLEVWVKALKNLDKAVLLVNRNATPGSITVNWTDSLIKWPANTPVNIRNLWTHATTTGVTQGYTATVLTHDVVMLRLTNPAVTAIQSKAGRKGVRVRGVGANGTYGLFITAINRDDQVEIFDLKGKKIREVSVAP